MPFDSDSKPMSPVHLQLSEGREKEDLDHLDIHSGGRAQAPNQMTHNRGITFKWEAGWDAEFPGCGVKRDTEGC